MNLLIRVVFSVVVLGLTSAFGAVDLSVINTNDISAFHEVVQDEIYRGAQPTDAGISQLKKAGFKTVLNLRNDSVQSIAESKAVKNLGLTYQHVPMSSFFAPSDADMNSIQVMLNRTDLQPLFVHCKHGEDRTGLVVGLYRVFSQGYSPEAAYSEMLNLGFHSFLFGLKEYFEEKTGYDP